jgi:glycosyl transferase family 87
MLVLGAAMAPLVFHHYDVVDCFLTWARASDGWRPWAIYLTDFRTACDYPPVVPYLLTVVERVRRMVGAGEVSGASVLLVKAPNLLAAAAHAPLCALGLRRILGDAPARRTALLLALSPALFVNAALWGQFDALLSLFVLAAAIALLHDRPGWAGAALGAGLATKLLAVVAVPLALVWTWKRSGVRGVAVLCGAAGAVMGALWLPYALAGAGAPVAAAYGGAVDYYPFRTVEAYNGWYLLDRFDIFVRGIAARDARLDTRAAFGPLTFRHVGLAALAAYTAALMVLLWRRPSRTTLAWALAVQFFAFFMLPTEMHQRYLLPAATLAALVAPFSSRGAALFFLVAGTATLNQALDLGRAVLEQALVVDPAAVADPPAWRSAIRIAATAVAVVNVGLFAWVTAVLPKETAAE